ncbi:tetratricopeptide repeat protein [Chromatocurvus halotolerans]|uniref:Putative TPR repeat methyltransferase n=1 Tax=Chromatocurvus halotolerans TaxID=1132028 RepID=A0A4R2KQZ6_9GAMM|nr:tetratricopeptide repeat protein [Chromatocurvus halotolerans]TCO76701.1 putative TPR repeat methyltransferase [Chromatocurvus halotolerans]
MARQTLSPDDAMKRARQLAAQNQVDAAKRLYHQILQQQPQNKKARKALRDLQATRGEVAALTQADFERVASLMQSNLPRARSEAARLCRLHPHQPALHNLHGVICSRLGDKKEAATCFEQALREEPRFAEALNNLASTLGELGRFDDAEKCFQALLKTTGGDAEIHYNHGNALRQCGRSGEAVNAYKKALNLRPLYPQAYNNMGNALHDQQDAAQACICYENALEIDPDFDEANRNLAQTYFLADRFAQAEQLYRRLLKKNAADTTAQLGVANCLVNRGKTEDAIEALQRVLALSPDAPSANHLLAALRGDRRTRAPMEYTRAVFDSYAERFEQHLTSDLAYDGPRELRQLLDGLPEEGRHYANALDIGCGTGLAGVAFKDRVTRLVGLDLSAGMLNKAATKGIYDHLFAIDAVDFLSEQEETFDLVLCADALPYVGDLQPLFDSVAQRLNDGGRFLLTTELASEGTYRLQSSARFCHSNDYVRQSATSAGMQVLAEDVIDLRKERNAWIRGGIYCLQRAPVPA